MQEDLRRQGAFLERLAQRIQIRLRRIERAWIAQHDVERPECIGILGCGRTKDPYFGTWNMGAQKSFEDYCFARCETDHGCRLGRGIRAGGTLRPS